MTSDDNIPTNVDIEVGYLLDAAGNEWIKLTFIAPDSPERFALAYSKDDAQKLVELLQAQIRRLGD
jgi:hypothetical protein